MFNVTLPDGSIRQCTGNLSAFEFAKTIGAKLQQAMIAAKVDGKLVDASYILDKDCSLEIITEKNIEALDIVRHSTAHLLAQAVQQLYPGAQVTIGPVVEDGFYYDFAYERAFTPDDLLMMEERMLEIVKQDLTIVRTVLSRKEAIDLFVAKNEKYKVDIIASINNEEDLSFYQQGEFIDLCRGPHVVRTGQLKAFKLLKVAGAFWRGDQNNEMLQRVYGTAWRTKQELQDYLFRLEEAAKRDHRKIGKALNLFHLQEEAPGMVFWHPKGWTIYQQLEKYIRGKMLKLGYNEVKTPQLIDRSLWEMSGHWQVFSANMFTVVESETKVHALKPMNCPAHVQIFNQTLHSYKELPLRLAEFGCCHRNEPSGALHGIMRVRSFVQDDGHIFCTEDQIKEEVSAFLNATLEIYRDFGFNEVIIGLSLRPEARVGSDELWDKAEASLHNALQKHGLPYEVYPGEGAFYGPKIEITLKDCLGRKWQCGTIQVDFSMPHRLGATYIDQQGQKQTPVMLHRAILGSFERFIGILLEETVGALPLWLSPVQVVIMNITDRQAERCSDIARYLQESGFRVHLDLRNEKIGFKIREHTLDKVPYQVIIGDNELSDKSVSVRSRDEGLIGTLSVDVFIERLRNEVSSLGRSELLVY